MRHRRAERCVVRAQAALEAGLEDEARTALAEARTLNPHAPDFDAVRISVRERQAAAAAAARRARVRRTTALGGVLAGTVVAGAVAIWFATSGADMDVGDPGAAAHLAAPAAAPQRASESRAASSPLRAEPDHVTSAPPTTSTTTEIQSPVQTTGFDPRGAGEALVSAVVPLSEPAVSTPPVSQPASSSGTEVPLPSVQDVNPSIPLARAADTTALGGTVPAPRGPDGLVRDLPSAALPAVSAPPPSATPAPVAAPPQRETVTEETRVRAVLARFEAAYSNLDASAAQSVWPSVDERSLARAFNTLQSQQVSLGRCAIVLSGPTAQAECSGSASWTPKVGGGRHSEARHWQFDLAATNGAWQIVRATAR